MGDQSIISALLLGIIEGLTEFIPVSSTAHVLLAGHFLGFKSPGNTFAVLIQLGAILAILLVYFQKLACIDRRGDADKCQGAPFCAGGSRRFPAGGGDRRSRA